MPPFPSLSHPLPLSPNGGCWCLSSDAFPQLFRRRLPNWAARSSGRQIGQISRGKWLCLIRITRTGCKGQKGLDQQTHLNHGCRNDSAIKIRKCIITQPPYRNTVHGISHASIWLQVTGCYSDSIQKWKTEQYPGMEGKNLHPLSFGFQECCSLVVSCHSTKKFAGTTGEGLSKLSSISGDAVTEWKARACPHHRSGGRRKLISIRKDCSGFLVDSIPQF